MRKKMSRKLTLNKKTIANLNAVEMSHAFGGATLQDTCPETALCTVGTTCPTFNQRECDTDDTWCQCQEARGGLSFPTLSKLDG